MLKLYKKVDGVTIYWETWDINSDSGVVHWGQLGQQGESKIIKTDLASSFHEKIQNEIDQKIEGGYLPIDENDLTVLLIEFKIDGMGTPMDLEKRTRLQSKMNKTLGWTGLGHCDGGSIGSGTMEVCCMVVDFVIAKEVIAKDLINTEFSDYLTIFDENAQL